MGAEESSRGSFMYTRLRAGSVEAPTPYPERRLAIAVIARAVKDYVDDVVFPDRSSAMEKASTKRWLLNRRSSEIGTFLWWLSYAWSGELAQRFYLEKIEHVVRNPEQFVSANEIVLSEVFPFRVK